jgi:hypothetical protein
MAPVGLGQLKNPRHQPKLVRDDPRAVALG